VVAQPFLDITPLVGSSGNEQGFLGLAFHPNYRQKGLFYVNYTNRDGDTVVARYSASPASDQADPGSGAVLLTVDQPFANHNGGHLAFGPDGYLYIGLGDGGSGGDPRGNGQNLGALLGKMLRIDVNQGDPYGIPANNPFLGQPGARPEIWAYGLRNPWRYSFDRVTGDLYIADVGQNAYEEISFQAAASQGGENYGWNRMEGAHCYPASAACSQSGLVLPVAEYGRNRGCSVTGGFVYRGAAQPSLTGAYFFADYCTGWFWSLQRGADGRWTQTELVDTDVQVSSFGEDEAAELYVTDLSRGNLYRLVAAPRN
jgi:glucose/arabinose dehydrogenase